MQATVERTTVTTHTADCKDCDFRLVRVPGASHQEGEKRSVLLDTLQYPRYALPFHPACLQGSWPNTQFHFTPVFGRSDIGEHVWLRERARAVSLSHGSSICKHASLSPLYTYAHIRTRAHQTPTPHPPYTTGLSHTTVARRTSRFPGRS